MLRGPSLDFLCPVAYTGHLMLRGPYWTIYAQRSMLDIFMLRGPHCIFYAQISIRDLLCSEVHNGTLMLIGPCWTFYAQSSMHILCSKVQAGQVHTGPHWREVHAGPFIISGQHLIIYAHMSMLDIMHVDIKYLPISYLKHIFILIKHVFLITECEISLVEIHFWSKQAI